MEATKALLKMGLRADVVAHVRATKADIDQALRCDARWVAVFLSVSDIHLDAKLRITRQEAWARAVEIAEYIRAHGLKARFTLEDASRAEPAFLLEMCKEVSGRGIERIGLPDTVGVLRPRGMYNLVKMVHDHIDASRTSIDVHCHNDLGLAMANALAGCEAGADQIHTSVDGYGERAGIPSLAEAAVALTLFHEPSRDLGLRRLRELSQLVADFTRLPIPVATPIVGDDVFKHKAGIHVAAVLRNPATYEGLDPKAVGNRRKIVLGPLVGKNGVAHLLSVLGLEHGAREAEALARALKTLHGGDLVELNLDWDPES